LDTKKKTREEGGNTESIGAEGTHGTEGRKKSSRGREKRGGQRGKDYLRSHPKRCPGVDSVKSGVIIVRLDF
jgi:hypothetical protein